MEPNHETKPGCKYGNEPQNKYEARFLNSMNEHLLELIISYQQKFSVRRKCKIW